MPMRGGSGEPIQGFRFLVEAAGFLTKSGFKTVTGLSEESEEANYREGTDRLTVHKYPGLVTYSDVELSDGLSTDKGFVTWRRRVVAIEKSGGNPPPAVYEGGSIIRTTVRISLYDQLGILRKQWKLLDAWPKGLSWEDLDAESSDILMRTLTLAHEGLIVESGAGAGLIT